MKSTNIGIIIAVVLIGVVILFAQFDKKNKEKDEIKENNITTIMPTSLTDLKIEDQLIGTGVEAKIGDTVTVQYSGSLSNGKIFDASRNHGDQGFKFTLGAGQVIKGWDVGVAGMKEGGKRKLSIPSSMGYGAQDVGGGLIPANSDLFFDVELVKVGK